MKCIYLHRGITSIYSDKLQTFRHVTSKQKLMGYILLIFSNL